MEIPETPPPLPPHQKIAKQTRLPPIQTRKLVNIRFNPRNQTSINRIRTIKQRAIGQQLVILPRIDTNGMHHLVVSGNASKVRTTLGTNYIVTNKPDENAMRRSRISAIVPNVVETRRIKPQTKVNKSSLLRTVLEKRYKQTKRTKNSVIRKLNFSKNVSD